MGSSLYAHQFLHSEVRAESTFATTLGASLNTAYFDPKLPLGFSNECGAGLEEGDDHACQ
jgi:hypothetical protein